MRPTRPLSLLVRNIIFGPGSTSTSAPSVPPAATFDVVNPGTETLVHTVERSRAEDLVAAIDAAVAGLSKWRVTPLSDRKAVLTRAAALLSDESTGWAARLIDANIAETPTGRWWSGAQIHMAAGALQALVDSADHALAEKTIEEENATFKIGREPYGVCLAIAPWNAVHVLTLRAIVTPLLAGNTVVLKTTEMAPHTQTLYAELLFEAGLPRDALSVVHVSTADAAELTPVLVQDRRVRHVNFTGSTRVGSLIASMAGRSLKPTLMELGGKAPVVLLPDADIETAASHIIFGAFMHAGQICMSTERVLVQESKYDELVAALRAAWDTVEKREPRALFQHASAGRVRDLLSQSLTSGASAVFPVGPGSAEDAFVYPTIVGDVKPGMRLYTEESFGPLAAIIRVPEAGGEEALIDEMVRIANETQYGLSAAVWGRDTERAQAVARRIDAGAVHVNAPTPADPPHVPHGGWKSSGWGRFNGVEGIRSFTQVRSIEISKNPHPLPLNVFEL